ncbi:MAG: alkaline phosphatase family protein [Candidatus Bathyarchaeia archaeon]|jgi:hypothetical protein
MLIEQTQIRIKGENGNLHYPQYRDNCISNIPDLLLEIFNVQKTAQPPKEEIAENICPEHNLKVILLVIDGFGFNQYLKHYKENQFLNKLATKGEVEPLTSVFPSQTTNALTTLNTGLTPQEHGIFEYFIYLKNMGIVNSLRFERLDPKRKQNKEIDPSIMLLKGKPTIHNRLREQGIPTFTHINAANAFNGCSKLIFQGSTVIPAAKTSDTIVQLRKKLEENSDNSAYFFVHLDTLDTISHEYGPDSCEYSAELSLITYLLNRELVQKIDPKTAKETVLLLTADHGGVTVNPKETIYLQKTALPLQTAKNRKPIWPTGSPRDIFLHIKKEKLAETKEWLNQKIGGKAQIIETQEAAKNGLFGLNSVSEGFFERTGNLLILPYGNETVWFENPEDRKISYLGQHGGLSKQEMVVPFAVANLSNLREKSSFRFKPTA